MICEAEGLLHDFAAEVSLATSKIKQGEFDDLKDTTKVLRDLRSALQAAFEERARVAKLNKDDAGVAYDYALDLDAARDEISRRLARLRDAGSGG